MAGEIIRPSALPDRPSPVASEKVPVDNGSTVGGATIQALVNAGRPLANQAEAEAGVEATKAMTPLTTKQAIQAQGDARFASAAQGVLADSAVQPGDIGTAAAEDVGFFATAAQGATADTALQSVVAGANVTVDNTDPINPVITAAAGVPGPNTVTNTILSDVATATFKGRTSAGTGDPQDMTATQALALLKAAGAYAKDNILGTVSQSGGVPTGAIIEKGSNANGEFVRYADGTQICWRRRTVNAAVSTTYGSIFSGATTAGGNFPAAFQGVPAVFASADNPAPGARWVGMFDNASSTVWPSMLLYDAAARVATDINLSQLAVGRWF